MVVFLRRECDPVELLLLLTGVAEHGQQRIVGVNDPAVGLAEGDTDWPELHQPAEAGLARDECTAREAPLGDIGEQDRDMMPPRIVDAKREDVEPLAAGEGVRFLFETDRAARERHIRVTIEPVLFMLRRNLAH